jgi:hypothetical protein
MTMSAHQTHTSGKSNGHQLGHQLESDICTNLQNRGIVVKMETDIKKEYYDFCSGVDILCIHNNKHVYIQCKWRETKAKIDEVNHFIYSASCINALCGKEHKLLWVSKLPPSPIGVKSINHSKGIIINNEHFDTLLESAIQFVLGYFGLGDQTVVAAISVQQAELHRKQAEFDVAKQQLIKMVEEMYCNNNYSSGIKNIIGLIPDEYSKQNIPKLKKQFISELGKYETVNHIQPSNWTYSNSPLRNRMNQFIEKYNALGNKYEMVVDENWCALEIKKIRYASILFKNADEFNSCKKMDKLNALVESKNLRY